MTFTYTIAASLITSYEVFYLKPANFRLFSDVSEPPGKPVSVDTTQCSITLSWPKPPYDGGSAIVEYLLQMTAEDSEEFVTIPTESKITATQHEVKDLKENQCYRFQVIAVNEAGMSEPGDTSDILRAIDILNEPDFTLDADLRQTVTVRSGGSIRLFVTMRGRPAPVATWGKEGGLPTERCSIETAPSYTILIVNNCCRDDSGIYTLVLQNVAGCKDLTIVVNVLDSPSRVGDLKGVDITKNSVFLQWDKPAHDGGACVSNYIVERRLTTRKSWATVATDVVRDSYRVAGLVQGEEYFFRVMPENKFGIGIPAETKQPIRASEVRCDAR